MEIKSINEIKQEYELKIPLIVETIKKQKAKNVLLQFPDGLKPYAAEIADELERLTGVSFFIWLGECFGACDIPIIDKKAEIDLVVQFGHSAWDYKGEKSIF